jgi:hypothetical protein
MTTLEVTHSKTAPEISSVLSKLQPSIDQIVNYTFTHHTRLIKPCLGFDDQAIALSFVPVSDETLSNSHAPERNPADGAYTYHHLRRDVWQLVHSASVEVGSRYVVPSAHLTVGRFITNNDFFTNGKIDGEKVKRLVDVIKEVNAWLEREFWPDAEGRIREGGEWVVGQELGLDCRRGRL